MVTDRAQEATTARQCRIRHQRHIRVVHERPQQRVQRRHRVARRGLLPREARRLRRLRGTAQLRRQHESRPPSVI